MMRPAPATPADARRWRCRCPVYRPQPAPAPPAGDLRVPGQFGHPLAEAAMRYLAAQPQQLLPPLSRNDHRHGRRRHRHHGFGHGCRHRGLDQLRLHCGVGLERGGTCRGFLFEATVVTGSGELDTGQGGVEGRLLLDRIGFDDRFSLLMPTISQLQAHAGHAFPAPCFQRGRSGFVTVVQAGHGIGQAAAFSRCGCGGALFGASRM